MPAVVRAAVSEGRLYELNPTFESDPVRRAMLLHPTVASVLRGPDRHPRMFRLQADLETFVKGERLAVSTVPFSHGTAYMGLLSPEKAGTWEVRSRDPQPGIRVLGRFAYKDVFVAFTWRLRSRKHPDWPNQTPLGDKNSFEYQLALIEVEERWADVFPGREAITGSDVRELLSERYHLV